MAQIKDKVLFSFISRGLFPEKQKGCHKWTKETEELLYIDQRILKKSKKRRKISYGMDWQPKGLRHGSPLLDNWLFQNVQDIRRRHQVYRENHENLKSGIHRGIDGIAQVKNPVRDILGKYAITITICYSDDVTQPHTQEMHRRIQAS